MRGGGFILAALAAHALPALGGDPMLDFEGGRGGDCGGTTI